MHPELSPDGSGAKKGHHQLKIHRFIPSNWGSLDVLLIPQHRERGERDLHHLEAITGGECGFSCILRILVAQTGTGERETEDTNIIREVTENA